MFDIIAHRGASLAAPENTLTSVQKAIELSPDYIEIDVYHTQDGVPIVIHDPSPERTTNSSLGKKVTDMTLSELKALDAGSWFSAAFSGEKIPTLEEILKLSRSPCGLMIDIKKGHSNSKPLVHSVCELITKNFDQGEIIVGSVSPHILEEIQGHYPQLSLIGIAKDFNMIPTLRAMKLPKMAIWYKLLTPYLISDLHEEHTKVWAFTVDDVALAKFLLSIHVDGLITNDPVLMQGLIG